MENFHRFPWDDEMSASIYGWKKKENTNDDMLVEIAPYFYNIIKTMPYMWIERYKFTYMEVCFIAIAR